MDTYEKIDKHTIKKIITETIDLRPLKERLTVIDDEIKAATDEPNEMVMPNFGKQEKIDRLTAEKKEIEFKLNIK
jgi:hypothetical protein